ncbi:WhiB family transcriptional regulator [Cellulomonas sp. HZM]|uniref:WhiB family transcriptional regulator n=1 Tax=Cellulomonas sp. HZM TaxID=1454010 RepID=UPI00049346EC|nr:WhiB family transcriptional regulator [Cellulomonas sp. HZM]
MRLTTLLDTDRTGSGPWPGTTAAPSNDSTATTDARFDEVVSAMIPCRTHDSELWFAEQTAQVEQAKALCRQCPLIEGCLAGAVDRAEPWGVWGGEVFIGGTVVATKRGRGRPRKNAIVA